MTAKAVAMTVSAMALCAGAGWAGNPVVSNVSASQNPGTRQVDITYDVTDPDGRGLAVSIQVSTNGGATYDIPAATCGGNGFGAGVVAGSGKVVHWNAGADWSGRPSTNVRGKVTAATVPGAPELVAGSNANGQVAIISESVAFLYSGTNAVQFGLSTGSLDAARTAVVRGRVLDPAGRPFAGVAVTVAGRPEFGYALTRTNGQYDMVVNGGGIMNVSFQRQGYIEAQRTMAVPAMDFVGVQDVMLVQASTNSTTVSLGAAAPQMAFGERVSDSSGSRRPKASPIPSPGTGLTPTAGPRTGART